MGDLNIRQKIQQTTTTTTKRNNKQTKNGQRKRKTPHSLADQDHDHYVQNQIHDCRPLLDTLVHIFEMRWSLGDVYNSVSFLRNLLVSNVHIVVQHDAPNGSVGDEHEAEEETEEQLVQRTTDPLPRHLLVVVASRALHFLRNRHLVQFAVQPAISHSYVTGHVINVRWCHIRHRHPDVVDFVLGGRVETDEDFQPEDETLHCAGDRVHDGVTVEETQRQDAEQHVDSGQHQLAGHVDGHNGQGLCGRRH